MTIYQYSSPAGNHFNKFTDQLFNTAESYFTLGLGKARKVHVIKDKTLSAREEFDPQVTTIKKIIRIILTFTFFVPIFAAITLCIGRVVNRGAINQAEEVLKQKKIKKESEQILKQPQKDKDVEPLLQTPPPKEEPKAEPEIKPLHPASELEDFSAHLIWRDITPEEAKDTLLHYKNETIGLITQPNEETLLVQRYDNESQDIKQYPFQFSDMGCSCRSSFSAHFTAVINNELELASHCYIKGFLVSTDEIRNIEEPEFEKVANDFNELFSFILEQVKDREEIAQQLLEDYRKKPERFHPKIIKSKNQLVNEINRYRDEVIFDKMISGWRFDPFQTMLNNQKVKLDTLLEQLEEIPDTL